MSIGELKNYLAPLFPLPPTGCARSCCCMGFPLILECGGLLCVLGVGRLSFVAVAFLVAEHRLWAFAQASVAVAPEHSLNSWDALASLLWGMWDLLDQD